MKPKLHTYLIYNIKQLFWSIVFKPSELESLSAPLRGPNTNYRKFIVLAHPRSGSSMVIAALRKHPNIVAFGELFVMNRIGFNMAGYDNQSGKLQYLRDRLTAEFLDRYIFSPYSIDTHAVGFKLFPEQASKRKYQQLRDWLASNKDVKIILLSRRNLLATYTSLRMARLTGKYGINDPAERSKATLTIDYSRCLEEFEKRKRNHEDILELTKGHDVLEVCYEDMISDMDQYFAKCQEFLGVDIHPLPIEKVKQEVRPLSEVIDNYAELRERFSKTEWKYLFE